MWVWTAIVNCYWTDGRNGTVAEKFDTGWTFQVFKRKNWWKIFWVSKEFFTKKLMKNLKGFHEFFTRNWKRSEKPGMFQKRLQNVLSFSLAFRWKTFIKLKTFFTNFLTEKFEMFNQCQALHHSTYSINTRYLWTKACIPRMISDHQLPSIWTFEFAVNLTSRQSNLTK